MRRLLEVWAKSFTDKFNLFQSSLIGYFITGLQCKHSTRLFNHLPSPSPVLAAVLGATTVKADPEAVIPLPCCCCCGDGVETIKEAADEFIDEMPSGTIKMRLC